eukprot:TRINITY_DN4298_c1_g2_i2.p1 TRINITY_DN4298_c1_g2~~TRINITY_DN4298_c1_g2_i2.p1  ORF type:complete len:561 (-),score=116.13 TRINITY_DN4298_c1_g2_i2:577-2259(-)
MAHASACASCGTEFLSDALFCRQCGERRERTSLLVDEVEAMIDEVARQRIAADMRGYENRPVGIALDSAVSSYGMQLRAWVDVQVEARISQVVPGLLENELAVVRAELVNAIEAVEHLRARKEADVRSVAEAQGKLLQVVEGMSRELAGCKICCDSGREALEAVAQIGNSFDEGRQQDAALCSDVRRLKEQVSSIERQLNSEDLSVRELSSWAERRFASDGRRFQGLEQQVTELEGRLRCKGDSDTGREALDAVSQVRNSLDGFRQQDSASSSEMRRIKEQISSIERQLGSEDQTARELSAWVERRFASDGHRFQGLEQQITALEARLTSRIEAMDPESEMESKIQGVRNDLEGKLESRIGMLRGLYGSIKEEQETRFNSMRKDIDAKASEGRLRSIENQLGSRLTHQVSQLEAIGEKLESEFQTALAACRQETRSQLIAVEERLGEQQASLQQRLAAELRSETTATRNRESAAIAALDEQLWITDQRLGQRIDQLAHAADVQVQLQGSKGFGGVFSSLVSDGTDVVSERVNAQIESPTVKAREEDEEEKDQRGAQKPQR